MDQNMIDATSGGALVHKTPTEARTLISNMDANSQQFGIRQEGPIKSVSEVNASYDQCLDHLTALVEKLVMGNTQHVKACGICSIANHPTDMCPTLQDGSVEQTNAVGGFPSPPQRKYDPFSNTYNPGWRDHPNFSYRARSNTFQQPYPNQSAHSQPSSSNSSMSLKNIVKHLATNTQQFQQETKNTFQHLETQIGHLATFMNRIESQVSGKLPSQTINNPKQNAIAITLRSGKVLEQPHEASKRELEKEFVIEESTSQNVQPKEQTSPQTQELKIPPPFPNRLARSKKEEHQKEILETFRKVEVNIPLLDAIKQIRKAMLDLGASINVMPRSIFKAMKVGNLKETGVIIQLADRSNAYPDGVVEDILVQVKDLVFPTDFYVVDMGEDNHSNSPSILLGRPFLKTARTNINVHEGILTMEFDGQVIKFNIYDSMKYPSNEHSVFRVDVIDSLVQKVFELNDDDSRKVALIENISESGKQELEPNSNLQEEIFALNSLAPINNRVSYLGLPLTNAKILPSIV
ncbi:uncharacterized protein [Rutidosis leptorrhynchoides]|uniref:uncharacterized protein n=1 Tax=Rutidosis leptorrhynchoides TaxID=125765 RepID=UPI003A9994E6